ncbi:hypothetical protein ES703_111116 [subsurface metagenome]
MYGPIGREGIGSLKDWGQQLYLGNLHAVGRVRIANGREHELVVLVLHVVGECYRRFVLRMPRPGRLADEVVNGT